ncbi:hypothetical protein STEG23_017165, partial [Scotinomys teguina]
YILTSEDSELGTELRENMQCLSLWVWITSLDLVSSSFIHLPVSSQRRVLVLSLVLYLLPHVLWLPGNFYILSSWRSGIFSSCCLALDSSSSFPCPAFRAIAKSLGFREGESPFSSPKPAWYIIESKS